jgi:Mn2+/Fe2+ NRAMP family transporter
MPQNIEPIKLPPKGLAILAVVGPAFVWCAEYIGSGEVILATRTGAILGTGVMWAIVAGIVLKYWIGMSGARYTVCTGEGMIDMFSRMPGPKNWAVWIVLIAQFASAAISIGSLAAAAGVFVNSLVPISRYFGGWLVTIFAVCFLSHYIEIDPLRNAVLPRCAFTNTGWPCDAAFLACCKLSQTRVASLSKNPLPPKPSTTI